MINHSFNCEVTMVMSLLIIRIQVFAVRYMNVECAIETGRWRNIVGVRDSAHFVTKTVLELEMSSTYIY